MVPIIVTLVVAVVLGCVTKIINENKGYYGGFWWGFWLGIIGIIVVACKPENISRGLQDYSRYNDYDSALSAAARESENERIIRQGGWKCWRCSRVNPSYVTTCVCGISANESRIIDREREEKSNINNGTSAAEEIERFKKLLDDGAITEEEFAAKKKQLLGL